MPAPRVPGGARASALRWLVPALALVAVLFVGQRAITLNAAASRGLESAARAQGLAADIADLRLAGGGRSVRTAIDTSLDALRADRPADSDLAALAAGLRRGTAPRRLLAIARSVSTRYTHEAADVATRARGALALLVIVGVALACLLLWTFWSRRHAQQRADHERRFRSLVQNSSDLIVVVGTDGLMTEVTPAVEPMLGLRPEELAGLHFVSLVHPDDVGEVGRAGVASWRAGHASGAWVDVESTSTDLFGDPAVRGRVYAIRDVSERKSFERQLEHQAFHDKLTGLPNRALFEDRVRHAVARSRRSGEPIAVLFVDLDDFKTVNDSLGHGAGDELLRQTAARLDQSLRGADTAGRLGGDEFGVLVEHVMHASEVDAVAARLHEALERPFDVGDHELYVRASIGIAVCKGDELGDELLRNADTAMYAAKSAGKGGHEVFRQTMHADVRKRLRLSGDLRRAVRDGEFSVDYQPLVALEDGRVLGAEALVRWEHPEYGRLAPLEFIPLAEETGLILPIGELVLREACREARRWQDLAPDAAPVYVSVNLSSRQFRTDGKIVDEVRRATADAGLDPSRLMLEITESVLMTDRDAAARDLQQLRALGVRVAIDDFGTGYSALSYLREFPIDIVKMDRSFVNDLGNGRSDKALVRSVLELGEALDMEIVAEGIEDLRQLDSLRSLHCNIGQGFYFSRPLSAAQMTRVLAERATRQG